MADVFLKIRQGEKKIQKLVPFSGRFRTRRADEQLNSLARVLQEPFERCGVKWLILLALGKRLAGPRKCLV
jgi:hypothetical protein